jgi:hypothetical protein
MVLSSQGSSNKYSWYVLESVGGLHAYAEKVAEMIFDPGGMLLRSNSKNDLEFFQLASLELLTHMLAEAP